MTESNQQERSKLPLPERMLELADAGATGILAVESGEVRRDIIFVSGEIRAARSSIEEEMLGLWLVQRNRIKDGERALMLLSQGGGRAPLLGHMLVAKGHLDLEVLEGELQELTLSIIRRAAEASSASLAFMDGQDPDQPDTMPGLTTPQIILIAARAFPDLARKRQVIGSLDQAAWPASAKDTVLEGMALTPTEGFVMSRLAATRPLSSLISLSPVPQEEAIATLYALKLAGVIQVGAPADLPQQGERERPEAAGALPEVVDESKLNVAQIDERRTIRALCEDSRKVDHYRALGLRKGATSDEIRDSWKRIEQRFSAGRASESYLRDLRTELETVYDRAQEAFSVLSNLVSRVRYDRILSSLENEEATLNAETAAKGEARAKARHELAVANFQRADELAREGEVYLAIRLLEQACALEPRPAELLKLSRLLQRNPLWKNRALATLRKALEVDPKFIDGWIELADFWRRRSSSERQRKALERALSVDPDHEAACEMYRKLMGKRELERVRRRIRERVT